MNKPFEILEIRRWKKLAMKCPARFPKYPAKHNFCRTLEHETLPGEKAPCTMKNCVGWHFKKGEKP
jgi:hypothetical protein